MDLRPSLDATADAERAVNPGENRAIRSGEKNKSNAKSNPEHSTSNPELGSPGAAHSAGSTFKVQCSAFAVPVRRTARQRNVRPIGAILLGRETVMNSSTNSPPDPLDCGEHDAIISRLAMSSDGRTLASASWDHSIRLWDIKTRRHLATLHGHFNEIGALAFAPDDKTLATSSEDRTLRFWNVETGQELLTIQNLAGVADTLLFAPDGSSLVGRLASSAASLRFSPQHTLPRSLKRIQAAQRKAELRSLCFLGVKFRVSEPRPSILTANPSFVRSRPLNAVLDEPAHGVVVTHKIEEQTCGCIVEHQPNVQVNSDLEVAARQIPHS